ncbi:class I SAM-dependent methyltransferase [Xanthobacter aminoxidans]|uniref:class I SAM-dependent methyltransferase n=1 Tax=Xanthobacter aminoxidans TaxID=186280 RepID=UPI002022FB1B|nr:class I SAM-dependent methyltransferase [Xanthobacter aminoxidans]MCL8382362.1 class I SAM-dependent methyltransferase [Xanthobacter aminoxidans]
MLTLSRGYECLASLGDNAELGFAQRAHGVEDDALLSWAQVLPDALLRGLETAFEGLFVFEHLQPFAPDMVLDAVSGIAFRSGMSSSWVDGALRFDAAEEGRRALHEAESAMVRQGVERLLGQLRAASRIFVYKQDERLSRSQMEALARAVARYNFENVLLVVEANGDPTPTLRKVADGLILATMDRFAPCEQADLINQEAWDFIVNQMMQQQAALGGAAIPPAERYALIGEQAAQWRSGIAYEIHFWSRWFETKGLKWPEDFVARQDPASPLVSDLRALIPEGASNVKILDVGAGPMTNIGYAVEGVDVEITASDPLADVYDDLAERHGVQRPVGTVFAIAEDLSAYFDLESFDIVNCRNALDHSADPLRGIIQMLMVAKPDSVVHLRHHVNEAEHEAYEGFHQFNFDCRDGRFVIWNKRYEVDVASALPLAADVSACLEGCEVVVTIRKREQLGRDPFRRRLADLQRAFVRDGISAALSSLDATG